MDNFASILYKLPKDMLIQIIGKTLFYDNKVDIQTILSFRNQCEAVIRQEVHRCLLLLHEQTYVLGDISIQFDQIYERARYRYQIKIFNKNMPMFSLMEIEDKYAMYPEGIFTGYDCIDAMREHVAKIISSLSDDEQKFILSHIDSFLENTERVRVLTEK